MKKIIAFFLFALYSSYSFACSTFLLRKDGHYIFGRNYDWVTGNGMVLVNARGVKKTSFSAPGAKTISWVAECGSITFNQYGKEFPHGGMNENGLVVELMWLSETAYPTPDERAGLNELQWIQYQLDNHTTVDQVIASDRHIRIDRQGAAPLHYLVADAAGNVATIEFINGKMVVHRGQDLAHPVLTNTVYADALQRFQNQNEPDQSFGDNSVDRFATACRMVQRFEEAKTTQNGVDYAFQILDKIAQGSFTKWRIVYDITTRKVYFITADGAERRHLALSDFDFSCSRPPLAFHLTTPKQGAIAPWFSPLDYNTNKALLEQTARESRGAIDIPAAQITGAAAYFNTVVCAK
jgi:penicillin V acylase-like amidase (Ntn superfamily)